MSERAVWRCTHVVAYIAFKVYMLFTARGLSEHGTAKANCLSVCLTVCNVEVIVVIQVGILGK